MIRPVLTLSMACLVASCGLFDGEEDILPGERIQVRPATSATVIQNTARPAALPAARINDAWTHPGGSASHATGHPDLQGEVTSAFVTSVGTGNSDEVRITSGPVVAGGSVYTISSTGTVVATTTSGQRRWAQSLVPLGEQAQDGFGGGVSLGNNSVFAATGFGEVFALDASDGSILWQANVGAPVRSAPTFANGRVFVVGRDDTATAFNADTGTVEWRVQGARGDTGVLGGGQVAVFEGLAVLPFSSGEILAVGARNGRRAWATALTQGRRGLARSSIGDITGDPVVVGTSVYAANQSGSLVSINGLSGTRNWTHPDGAVDAPLVVGDSVWFVSDQAELIRLDAANGNPIWSVQLPARNPRDEDVSAFYAGPVLAGGRLVVATDTGLSFFSPTDGSSLGAVSLPDGAASAPAVAGGRLYVQSGTGSLHAFE
ncbi:outer membrane protein assembly factor BamB family protein [Pontivivens insulae]|uniref:Outer membrane protein assembly factor BamB n=1 Tax=Pontivivens insulae TaxID=1639689 RepID=A0A2R8ABC2_9RHOB|nr:PQQ-like beta-propeller repeat protein [Pontivivens insulae]RED11314.1 outer membrane protein assembly factor BamB [Pontivivens insulae]SPF29513.1 Outer membrane protein assembly factor BamB [Pontivivens insulae]